MTSQESAEEYPATADTMFGPQFFEQAWSQGEQPPAPAPYRSHSWVRVGALTAAFVLLVGVVIYALIASVRSHNEDHNAWPAGYSKPPTVTVSNTPEPSLSPVRKFTPPPDVPAQSATRDGEFLQALTRDGLTWSGDPSVIIADAHRGCSYMRVNHLTPVQYAVQLVGQPNLGGTWVYSDAIKLIRDMATYYCPEADQ
jgi:hypothetical protein